MKGNKRFIVLLRGKKDMKIVPYDFTVNAHAMVFTVFWMIWNRLYFKAIQAVFWEIVLIIALNWVVIVGGYDAPITQIGLCCYGIVLAIICGVRGNAWLINSTRTENRRSVWVRNEREAWSMVHKYKQAHKS